MFGLIPGSRLGESIAVPSRITGYPGSYAPEQTFNDAGQTYSGKSAAVRHECARIPDFSRFRRC